MRWIGLVLICLIDAQVAGAGEKSNTGRWVLPDGSAVIEILATGGRLEGRIVALLRPEEHHVAHTVAGDNDNDKDKDKRNTPSTETASASDRLVGLTVLTLDQSDDDGSSRGKVYDPRSGKRYRCVVKRESVDILSVHAYLGFKSLGETQRWERLDIYKRRVEAMLHEADRRESK